MESGIKKPRRCNGLCGKKAARAVLENESARHLSPKPEGSDLSLRAFVDAGGSLTCSARCEAFNEKNYDSTLELHILPVFGDLQIEEIVPLHVERFSQTKLESGLSAKTVRNLRWSCRGSCHSRGQRLDCSVANSE